MQQVPYEQVDALETPWSGRWFLPRPRVTCPDGWALLGLTRPVGVGAGVPAQRDGRPAPLPR